MKTGRPSLYNEELATRICELVATHTDCLDVLIDSNEWMPCSNVIYLWRHRHPFFSQKYLQAMHSRACLYEEETFKIASEKHTYEDEKGNKRFDAGAVAWQKMNVNLRQWHASKLAPKIYGDKQVIEQTTSENDSLKSDLTLLRSQLDEKNTKDY